MAHGLEGGVERERLRTMVAMASDDSSAGNLHSEVRFINIKVAS